MKSLYFTEEHELFRDTMKDFCIQEIQPYEGTWEAEGKIDRSLFRKMGEMGFLGLEFPRKIRWTWP